jgi:ribonuclease Z
MKPSFHARLINGPFDDPGLYIRVLREGRALMFDIGFTTSLSARDILKITDIFVSHTHVDHFIGFDNILRVSLKKTGPLKLYGPEGFIDRIEGKLKSYTWNLIEDYPLVIEIIEVNDKLIRKALFKAENSFKREDYVIEPFNGVLMKDSFCLVSAVILDHQIPCLAFGLEEDCHINIDKAKLSRMGLPVGPWLKELKMAIRNNINNRDFTINGTTYTFEELRDIANITRGQKLSYVVDAVGNKENMENIVNLVRGSDVLYIETYFLDRDRDRARDRYHLTAKEAGRIAGDAGVGRIEAIHFSPRYMNDPESLVQEAQEAFKDRRF